jgi:hypothetical protein
MSKLSKLVEKGRKFLSSKEGQKKLGDEGMEKMDIFLEDLEKLDKDIEILEKGLK